MLLGLIFKTKSIFKWESCSVRNYQNILTVSKFYFHKSFQVNIFVKANSFPQTVSVSVNQHVLSLKTLLPAWHKGSHLKRPLLQEPVTLHPPGSCHCSKSAGFGFYPSLRKHPPASCASQHKSHVSAEVCSLSSQKPEDNRKNMVRETLHLQASPHTYPLGKA